MYDALIKFPHIRWLYSTDGYRDFSSAIYDRSLWIHQLIAGLDLYHWQLLIAAQALAGICMIIGWRPKFWLVVWLIVLRLTMRRNDLAAHIGDLVFTFFCYWILFLPLKFTDKGSFLNQNTTVTSPWTLPFYAQLFCLYFFAGLTKLAHSSWQEGVFFIRSVQSEEMWLSYRFFTDYPNFWSALSYALPFIQIVVSLLLFVPWKKPWIRGFIIAFWCFFHAVGYLFVPDATMFWFVCVPLIVLIPKEFWEGLSQLKNKKTNSVKQLKYQTQKKPWKAIKAVLAMSACGVIVSSNHLALFHYENRAAQKYFHVLSKTFLYQFWFVFTDFSTQHNNYEFYLKQKKEDTDLILLPLVDRADSLIAGRFHVMKRAIHNPYEKERWVAALCLDHSEKRETNIYSIVVKRHIRKFTDQPPLIPATSYADEQEYICEDLIAKRMGRYN